MLLQILILLLGLAILVAGADCLVEGSCSIARRAGLSDFVIGMTIVGIGTSCPELVVSLIGAFQGNSEIAVGNVVGSNISNVLLILGITGLLSPVVLTKDNIRKDIPVCLAVTLLLILLGLKSTFFGIGENQISRLEGVLFLSLFLLYMVWLLRSGTAAEECSEEKDAASEKERKLGPAVLLAAGGLAGLVAGGQMFVKAAERIAFAAGMSDKFIAITILAVGTSMPELVTSIVAAVKKRSQLALGNIIGSNVSNILLILGSSALVCPLSFKAITPVDLCVLMAGPLLVLASARTGRNSRIGRYDAALLLACELGYISWLTVQL